MKIMVLTSVYPQPDDAFFNVTPTVQYFSEKWAECGHEVFVIHNKSCFPFFFYWMPEKVRFSLSSKSGFNFPTKGSRKELHIQKQNLHVYRFPMVKVIPHGRYSRYTINKQFQRIKKVAEYCDFRPDLIVSHWVNPQIELIIKLGDLYGAKTSLVFHDDCSPKAIEWFDLRNTIKKLDAVGCRSKSYAEYVQTELKLKKLPFICYSGIPDDLAELTEREYADRKFQNKPVYLYVGRLVEYKNVDVIIEALHEYYGEKPFEFHIVGSGAEMDNLKSLVERYKIDKNVTFHGQVPREKVFELMKEATYFVMVSKHETFGMVYIEAMLAGCVTIAGKGGGVDGVIIDGVNGFLSTEGSVNDLVSTFLRISTKNENELVGLRQNAMQTALTFSDKNVAEKYLQDVDAWKEKECHKLTTFDECER